MVDRKHPTIKILEREILSLLTLYPILYFYGSEIKIFNVSDPDVIVYGYKKRIWGRWHKTEFEKELLSEDLQEKIKQYIREEKFKKIVK